MTSMAPNHKGAIVVCILAITNNSLTALKVFLLNKKEIMLGTGNLANYPELVKS